MTLHNLKTHPPYFEAVARGDKPFEVRRNDRGFQCGDTLILREYDPAKGAQGVFSGRKVECTVTYVYAADPGFGGIESGYVVLGLDLSNRSHR